jgi:prefoldin subunit 5
MAQQQRLDITQLSLEELQNLQEQVANEVNTFAQNIVALQQTATRFATAGHSVEYLSEQRAGQPVLLPLTESLYVAGVLESVETVLLEIGTGYFVEVRRMSVPPLRCDTRPTAPADAGALCGNSFLPPDPIRPDLRSPT